MRVVTREAMEALRERQTLDVAIESLERDLDRGSLAFSDQKALFYRLQRLRAMRSSLIEVSTEAMNREEESPVR